MSLSNLFLLYEDLEFLNTAATTPELTENEELDDTLQCSYIMA